MTRRAKRAAAGAALAVIALAGCVGPARDTSTYTDKAVRTAQDALSQVQTARLAADADQRGRLLRTYFSVLLGDAEEAITSIQSTFDSIQPPDTAAADDLREALDGILVDGVDGVSRMRIAARRGDSEAIKSAADDLEVVARDLSDFAEGNG